MIEHANLVSNVLDKFDAINVKPIVIDFVNIYRLKSFWVSWKRCWRVLVNLNEQYSLSIWFQNHPQPTQLPHLMTSSNVNMFRITGPFKGNPPVTAVHSPHKGQWHGVLMLSLICGWTNVWTNNRYAGDLRRHRAHYNINIINIGDETSTFNEIITDELWISLLSCRHVAGFCFQQRRSETEPLYICLLSVFCLYNRDIIYLSGCKYILTCK